MKPSARKTNIFVENLPEEVVLYDKSNSQVHCLNKAASAIWESCDGSRTVDELARIVAAKSGTPPDRQVVLQALAELDKADLLEGGRGKIAEAAFTSRREAVGKIALAGTALVATIIAATPAAHASCHDRKPTPPPHHHK
jgi:hypothetical protein